MSRRTSSVPFDAAPVRVLWLINQLGPGGAERLMISAAKRHDRRRFHFEAAFVLQWHNALAAELAGTGVPVHCLGVDHAADLRWMWRLARLLRKLEFDVVHAHSPMPASLLRLYLQLLPQGRRPVMIATEHNAWDHYKRAIRIMNGLTVPLDDVHLSVSSSARETMPRRLQKHTRVVVHGVPVEELAALRERRAALRRDLAVDDDTVLIVTAANLRPQKNYPNLLHAAAAVVANWPQVRFIAVGGGPLEDEIRALCRNLGLDGHMELLGYRNDAPSVIAAADIFTMASSWEGYPVAVMEALALGIPVVATAVGGIPDAVRHDVEGILVPPDRPSDLARALGELITDPERRAKMSAAALMRGEEYDIAHATRVIEDIYIEALRQRQTPRWPRKGWTDQTSGQ